MRKTLFIGAFLILICAVSFAQMGMTFPAGKNYVAQKVYWPTEGDYICNTAATANDTSSAYAFPKGWEEIWVLSKPSLDSTTFDSIDYDVHFYVKNANQPKGATGGGGVGWVQILPETLDIVTGDSSGEWVKLATCPPTASSIRIINDGVTGNGNGCSPKNEIWLIFRRSAVDE